ncbi:hypothetical protein LJC14_06395 [Treponema sp. OttesenSCG-928-L16]|nr:hypothetical protein [Treponema sp. OttesenSCG-928-L16]
MGIRERFSGSCSQLKRRFPGILGLAVIAGSFLFILLLGSFLFFISPLGGNFFPGKKEAVSVQDPFLRELNEFDRNAVLAASPEAAVKELDRIEKRAAGIEALLSVLKRRRIIAREYPAHSRQYSSAARRVREAYPHSSPAAAVFVESAMLSDAPLQEETREELLEALRSVRESRFEAPVLGAYVLLGQLSRPDAALELPQAERLLASAAERSAGLRREQFLINGAALNILKKNPAAARPLIERLLQNPDVSAGAMRFAAVYYYDSGNPLRAAELLSSQEDVKGMAALADALYMAAYKDSARTVWRALVSPGDTVVPMGISEGSYYNLAMSAPDTGEAEAWFKQLLALSPAHVYGSIRYSRFLDDRQAMALLEKTAAFRRDGLLDLEIIRRNQASAGINRTIADTWLLIGRNPRDERLYEWAAWYFGRQREYGETEMLLRMAGNNGVSGPWIPFHEAVRAMTAGSLETAEACLDEISAQTAPWQLAANKGLIYEAKRSPSKALEYYELAAAQAESKQDTAAIQLRIARCFQAMGQTREALRVLEYARDLDPENLYIRLELQKLQSTTSP